MKAYRIPLIPWLVCVLAGCSDYTLYLQDVHVKGPISQPPVPITDGNQEKPLKISPHFSFVPGGARNLRGRMDGHSPVGTDGMYHVDTLVNGTTVSFREHAGANTLGYAGQNLTWDQPSASLGLNLDYTFAKHWALSLGADYCSIDGEGLWGYRAGLGIFSEGPNYAIRFDGGVRFQQLGYDALTVVVAEPWASDGGNVTFFHDRGKSTPVDLYGSLTFNSRNPNWPAHFFIQLGLSKQSLAKFKPATVDLVPVYLPAPVFLFPFVVVHDERAQFSSTVVVFTPGIYFKMDESTTVLLGIRINLQTEILSSSPDAVAIPFVQVDFAP